VRVTVIIFYGCETWHIYSEEENKLQPFESKVPPKIFGPSEWEAGLSKSREVRRSRCCRMYWRQEEHTKFWWEYLLERSHMRDWVSDRRMCVRCISGSGSRIWSSGSGSVSKIREFFFLSGQCCSKVFVIRPQNWRTVWCKILLKLDVWHVAYNVKRLLRLPVLC
jgi:hypothetical protein